MDGVDCYARDPESEMDRGKYIYIIIDSFGATAKPTAGTQLQNCTTRVRHALRTVMPLGRCSYERARGAVGIVPASPAESSWTLHLSRKAGGWEE